MERNIEPKTILITGVAGLLGGRLADWILENHPEVKVVGIDDLSGGFAENVDSRVVFYNIDLLESKKVDEIFMQHRPDIVYHFAAYAAECLSPFIRQFNYRNNLEATAGVVNNCIKMKVKRLVFTSSMAVYGNGQIPFAEDDILAPIDPYGVAKAACERDIQIAGEQHGLEYCILRPHNVYGAKQNIWDPYRNVLGIFMYKLLTGDPITIFGDGKQTRAFSCIDDVLEPMWKAGTWPKAANQIINLGGVIKYTINEAAQTVFDAALDLKHDGIWQETHPWIQTPQIIHLPQRHEVREAHSTFQKSFDLLHFDHKTYLIDGVTDMWKWVLKQPKRDRVIWDEYEVDQGLYSYWKPGALKDGYYREEEIQTIALESR